MVGVAVKVTLVPEQMVPVGEAAMVILAVPVVGDVGVSVPKLVLVVTPLNVPPMDEGRILPATAEVLVA